jgi:hypothetical protein
MVRTLIVPVIGSSEGALAGVGREKQRRNQGNVSSGSR